MRPTPQTHLSKTLAGTTTQHKKARAEMHTRRKKDTQMKTQLSERVKPEKEKSGVKRVVVGCLLCHV